MWYLLSAELEGSLTAITESFSNRLIGIWTDRWYPACRQAPSASCYLRMDSHEENYDLWTVLTHQPPGCVPPHIRGSLLKGTSNFTTVSTCRSFGMGRGGVGAGAESQQVWPIPF